MRIGVIGTTWGLMHVGAFRAAGAEVAALCGQHPGFTREVAAREGIPLATADVRELCAAVDAVAVARGHRAAPPRGGDGLGRGGRRVSLE